ncbi:MAG: PEP-CTERM sorting domain-containing protein [Betaproteobacteria bacterium]|nr:PEP-CTERM sorting domain-containing protein [Betaproteobacteria bacterium]
MRFSTTQVPEPGSLALLAAALIALGGARRRADGRD